MIAILSDLHLGLKAAPTPASLSSVIAGATEVILNGDAAESASTTLHTQAHDALAELTDRCTRSGATLLRLEGNHDPATGDLHALRELNRVFITHGHCFHPAIAPWSPAAAEVTKEFRRAHAASAQTLEPLRSLHAARAASICERTHERARSPLAVLRAMALRPWVFPVVIGYWRIFPELAARFLETCANHPESLDQPPARVIVAGHSHRAGAWLIRGKLVLNTGSFTFPGQPHVVHLDEGTVSLTPLVKVAQEWRQDQGERRSWRIEEIA